MGRKYALTSNYVMRKIVDESILVPVSPQLKSRDCLFVMNPTACAVYEGLRAGLATDEILQTMLDEYENVRSEELQTDIDELITHMIDIEALYAASTS
jgi:hypothetical protein